MTEGRRDFYVYILFREDGVTPFYVGKGCGSRVLDHSSPKALAEPTHKARVARKTMGAIGRIPHELIFRDLPEGEAHAAEIQLIAALGRKNNGTGILTNLTDGGEGTTGLVHCDEARAAISAATSKFWNTPSAKKFASERSLRRWADPVERERMLAAIGAGHTAESRERQRVAVTSTWADHMLRSEHSQKAIDRWTEDEFRNRHAAAMTIVMADPAYREKLSVISNARWEDAEQREAMVGAMRRYHATDEAKAIKSAAGTKRFSNPAERERMAELVSATWQDPALRAAQSARSTASQSSPEYRSAMSDAVRAAKNNPEAKARASASQKAAWARRKAVKAAA